MEISYSQCGDYLIPDLVLPEEEQHTIGKYGRMRKRYLQEHRPVLYSNLILSCKLYQHLAEIDHTCVDRMNLLTRQMADREGATEALKAVDQFEWVRHMILPPDAILEEISLLWLLGYIHAFASV